MISKKRLSLGITAFAITSLFSCTSPESAAKEVCDCISKTTKSASTGEAYGNASECAELQAKYSSKFEGKDQNEFSRRIADCTMGSFKMR